MPECISINLDELKILLMDLYSNPLENVKESIARYKTLYGLPVVKELIDASEELISYSEKVRNFVVVAIYNHRREILVVDGGNDRFSGGSIGPRLVGGEILADHGETIEDAVARIVNRNTSLDVYEVEPIAVVENTFRRGRREATHNGIAFIARTDRELLTPRYTYHQFLSALPDEMAFSNKKIADIAFHRIRSKHLSPPLEEIEAAERHAFKAYIHRYFFKTIFLKLSTNKLKHRLKEIISSPSSYLDVSAGDDRFIIDLVLDIDPELSVANDISWKQMGELRRMAKQKNLSILFTNHNAAELPFNIKFDVVMCKNTLHHVSGAESMISLLSRLADLSRKLIIVDIEEPKRNRMHRIINWYYEEFYGDGADDHRFLSRDQFRKLIGTAYEGNQIDIEIIETIKANYLVATISGA